MRCFQFAQAQTRLNSCSFRFKRLSKLSHADLSQFLIKVTERLFLTLLTTISIHWRPLNSGDWHCVVPSQSSSDLHRSSIAIVLLSSTKIPKRKRLQKVSSEGQVLSQHSPKLFLVVAYPFLILFFTLFSAWTTFQFFLHGAILNMVILTAFVVAHTFSQAAQPSNRSDSWAPSNEQLCKGLVIQDWLWWTSCCWGPNLLNTSTSSKPWLWWNRDPQLGEGTLLLREFTLYSFGILLSLLSNSCPMTVALTISVLLPSLPDCWGIYAHCELLTLSVLTLW